jgi:hypothetical protein
MGCCGSRRAAAAQLTATQRPAPVRPADSRAAPAIVPVRYVGDRPAYVRGTATGRRYSFARSGLVEDVDARDLPGLRRTGLFRPV